MLIQCEYCGKQIERCVGHINRSRAKGWGLYCDRKCSGLAHRLDKTKAQKVEEKRVYDIEYRRKNLQALKDKKRAYFRKTYDPANAAVARRARMPYHVEYCRRPEYRRYKTEYDKRYRARRLYGPFSEAFLLLAEIDREVGQRMSDYEIRLTNGTLNKQQTRRRNYERLISNES